MFQNYDIFFVSELIKRYYRLNTLYKKIEKFQNVNKKQQNLFCSNFRNIIPRSHNTYLFFSSLVSQRLIIEVLRPQTHNSCYDSSGRVISPTQRPTSNNTLLQHSQETDNHVYRRDSNPQSQQPSGRRLTP
jgi:hypothetical protein